LIHDAAAFRFLLLERFLMSTTAQPRPPWQIAFSAFVATLFAGRRVRVIVLGAFAILGLIIVSHLVGWLSDLQMKGLRASLLSQAVPVLAVLLSEFPARDGISNRTILYHLLGPVPRTTLLLVRMAVTWVLLAGSVSAAVLALTLVSGARDANLGGELLAVALGGAFYLSLFGLVHLMMRRGLFLGLALIALVDAPLSRLPFSLRNLAPMTHVQAIASTTSVETFVLPIDSPVPSMAVALTTLLVVTLCAVLLSVWRFNRQDLGEIC